MSGALVLVGTPIGNLGDLSPRAVDALRGADVIACEDTRRTRKLLSATGIGGKRLLAVHEHNEAGAADELVSLVVQGQRVAVVTDAGMPGISDPGERLVARAVAEGVRIEVVPGPSAALAALVVSGLPTGRFVFEGFLPRRGRDRAERLAAVAGETRTVVLFEAPHRLAATMADLAAACGATRHVVLARELTKLHEELWRGTLGEAAAHAIEGSPRGEYVVVLSPAPPPGPASAGDVEAALRSRLATGVARKAAVAAVADELGVPKRQVYELAVQLRGEDGGNGG